jgi:predicted phosphodiesterase
MRIAVLSDIHGNCIALDAVLADLRRDSIDRGVCLGDTVQGGAQPAEVVGRLRELGWPVVMGNADDFLLTGAAKNPAETITPAQLEVRTWQLAKLSPADIHFIESFEPALAIPLGPGKRLFCFHGSPASFNDIIFADTPEAEFQRLLNPFQSDLLAGGHTHLQMIRRTDNSFFFNPGSVGLACDNRKPRDEHFRADPWADYAVLSHDSGRLGLEFRRVPFDVAAWLRVTEASGRPDAETVIALYAPRTR